MTLHVGQLGQECWGHADVPQGRVDAGIIGALVDVVELNIRPPLSLRRPLEGKPRTRVVVHHDPAAWPFDDAAPISHVSRASNREQRFAVGLLDGLGVKEHSVLSHRVQHRPIPGTSQDIFQSLNTVKNLLVSQEVVHPRCALLIEAISSYSDKMSGRSSTSVRQTRQPAIGYRRCLAGNTRCGAPYRVTAHPQPVGLLPDELPASLSLWAASKWSHVVLGVVGGG